MQVEARSMTEVKQWLVIQGMLQKGPKFIHNLPFAEDVAESKLQHLAETFSHSSQCTVPLSRLRTQRTSLSDFGESKNKRVGIRERERVCVVHACARVHEVSLTHQQNLYQGISVMERLKRRRKRLGVMTCWPLCTYVHHFPSGWHAVVVVTRPNGHKIRLNYDVF